MIVKGSSYTDILLSKHKTKVSYSIPTFRLNQVEQADVIMAEYREGWAARAEKVFEI